MMEFLANLAWYVFLFAAGWWAASGRSREPYSWECPFPGCTFSCGSNVQHVTEMLITNHLEHKHEQPTSST